MAQYNISSISFGGDTFILPSGGGGSSANVGDIRMIAGSTAPAKWMLCNGDVISRGTYLELFDVISLLIKHSVFEDTLPATFPPLAAIFSFNALRSLK